jgi:hypothetical protein
MNPPGKKNEIFESLLASHPLCVVGALGEQVPQLLEAPVHVPDHQDTIPAVTIRSNIRK